MVFMAHGVYGSDINHKHVKNLTPCSLHGFVGVQGIIHSVNNVLIPEPGPGVSEKGPATSHRKILQTGRGAHTARFSFRLSQALTDTAGAIAIAASGAVHAKDATAVGTISANAVSTHGGHRKVLETGEQKSRFSFQLSQALTDTAGAIAIAASGANPAKAATAVGTITVRAISSHTGHRKVLQASSEQRSHL